MDTYSIAVEDLSDVAADIAAKAGPHGWQHLTGSPRLHEMAELGDDEVATEPTCASEGSAEVSPDIVTQAETEDHLSEADMMEDSSSDDEHVGTVSCSSFERRLECFPCAGGDHSWMAHDEAAFEVRSAKYFKDRKKQPAGRSLLELINVDFFVVGADGPITSAVEHPDLCPAACRQRGDDRFLFVLNWIFPPYQCVIVGALNPESEWLANDTPQSRVWRRFLDMPDNERKDALKILFTVVEGSWLVRSAAPRKPLLVGRSLKTESHYAPGHHLEIAIDVSTGKTEQVMTNMMMRSMKGFQPAMAVVIEGRQEDELPEAPLFCTTLRNLDTQRLHAPRSAASRRKRRAATVPSAPPPVSVVPVSTINTAPVAATAMVAEAIQEAAAPRDTEELRPTFKVEMDLPEAEVPYCSVPGTPELATPRNTMPQEWQAGEAELFASPEVLDQDDLPSQAFLSPEPLE